MPVSKMFFKRVNLEGGMRQGKKTLLLFSRLNNNNLLQERNLQSRGTQSTKNRLPHLQPPAWSQTGRKFAPAPSESHWQEHSDDL